MVMAVGPVTRGGATGAGFYMRLHGLEDLQARLESLHDQDLDEEMEEAAQDALDAVMVQSQAIVPYDTGALHDSAFVSVMRLRGGTVEAAVGYDTDYALFVHENPDAFHKPPTRWKFLEEPFMRAQPKILSRIAAGVKKKINAVAR